MTEELVFCEITGRKPGRFRFTDDEFRGHYATLTPINYEIPIV